MNAQPYPFLSTADSSLRSDASICNHANRLASGAGSSTNLSLNNLGTPKKNTRIRVHPTRCPATSTNSLRKNILNSQQKALDSSTMPPAFGLAQDINPPGRSVL